MHLITGHSGFAHITAANDGDVNSHVFGTGKYVFDSRDKFRADLISNNIIHINSGEGLLNGRYFEIATGTHDTANIDNGSAGTNRIDLIVARYIKDGSTAVESMSISVIKGEASSTPVAPAYESGNILDGVGIADFPLYKVTIEGLTVKKVEPLFSVRKDILADVIANNTATVEEVVAVNENTKVYVQQNNAATKAEIAENNDITKAEIKASNDATVAAVQASNAETIAIVDEKVSAMLTCTEIWTNESGEAVTGKINHPTISGFKYLEYIFSTPCYYSGDTTVEKAFMSSGRIPTVAIGNVTNASSILSHTFSDFGMLSGGNHIENYNRSIRSANKATYVGTINAYIINNAYHIVEDVIIDSEEKKVVEDIVYSIPWNWLEDTDDADISEGEYLNSLIVLEKILAYK